MKPTDNFSQKKKHDLIAIATLFGILTREQASRMTKPQLITFLKEQERQGDDQHEPVAQPKVISTDDALLESTNLLIEAMEGNHEVLASPGMPAPSKKSRVAKASSSTDTKKTSAKAASKKPAVNTPKNKTVATGKKKISKADAAPEVTPMEAYISLKEENTQENPLKEEDIQKDTLLNQGADLPSLPVEPIKRKRGRPKKITAQPESVTESSATVTSPKAPDESVAEGTPAESDKVTDIKPPRRPGRPKGRSVIIQPKDEPNDSEQPISQTKDAKSDSAQSVAPDLVQQTDEHASDPLVTKDANTSPSQENDQQQSATGDSQPVKTFRAKEVPQEICSGVLEIMPEGYGFLRRENYLQGQNDLFVPNQYIRRFSLRTGDFVEGPSRPKRDIDRYQALQYIKQVNGLPPEKMIRRPVFDRLTPIYPEEKFILETEKIELSTRIIDLVAPIGKGQRGMIVSPPKAGKTILLQKIANAISINNPDSKLIVLLIDERPEEVTDMQRSINGEVVYSTFDKTPENHVRIVELVLERAMRLVELGQDVVILLDSITRLARAYNLTINPTGRTLSGGLDPGALYGPKRFFGAARNIEGGGSLTIVATSLIDTGSRMDEVIFEEFKGTGNMEVYLDRKLSEKRIFPAIDINKSGTRREELLLSSTELDAVWTIRKAFGQLDTAAVTEMIINLLLKTTNNNQFVQSVNVSFNDKAVFEAMRGTRPAGNGNGNGNGGSLGGK